MEATLITASDSSVVLINGGQACNVFWQVGSSATLGTDTDFQGNILAAASITMNTDATLEGRALARTGAVTLDTNVISIAQCAEPPGDDPSGDDPSGDDPSGDDPSGDDPPANDPPVECSTDLMASANEDSSITLTWNAVDGAQQYRIHRAVGGAASILHDEVDGDAMGFLDTDTESGVTYRYEVRPVDAGVEREECDIVEVTAIPFFPGFVAAPLAIVAGVVAYVRSRRRT